MLSRLISHVQPATTAARRVVVVNSTPIITLAIVDQLLLLRDLYETARRR